MSPPPRLFIDGPLSESARLSLDDEQARYLNQVLRKKPGELVRLFNGRDGEWQATITAFDKRGGSLVCSEQSRQQCAVPDIHVLFAPLKRQRTDLVIEKATELGAAQIAPVFTARTNAEHVRLDRLRAIAIEAAEQTERLDVPGIAEPLSLEKTLAQWDPARRLIFADEAGDDAQAPWGGAAGRAVPIQQALTPFINAPTPWAILIGPEGGFTPQERAQLRDLAFVTPVSLGPRILRAETALFAALAIWQSLLGDWIP